MYEVMRATSFTELMVYDKHGNPIRGERVQFHFVNDDGSLAPASGGLAPRSVMAVLDTMGGGGNHSGMHRYPQGHVIGSRRSRSQSTALVKTILRVGYMFYAMYNNI